MSEDWAEQQRRTNKLVRIAADYIFNRQLTNISPKQLYGLCQLTWISRSSTKDNPSYIQNIKIPALGLIFGQDFSNHSINQIANNIYKISGVKANKLITSHTGFTNFYNAYRNSSLDWIEENFTQLLPLFREAFELSNENQGLLIIREIARLPLIPKANNHTQRMKPEHLLTPVFFALDSRIKFPLLNGNKGVKKLLSKLKVTNSSLEEQYLKMISLYALGGVRDAADLDQIGNNDISDFIEVNGAKPTKKLLETKPYTGEKELPLKDESDVISLQKSRLKIRKRLHNVLTNRLKAYLTNYTLFEGASETAMYDTLVENYDGKKNNLLIEVKSSSEPAHIRMAIGQLFDYWFKTNGKSESPHLAILLPNHPGDETIKLLEWLDIGVLWFSSNQLKTSSNWLETITKN